MITRTFFVIATAAAAAGADEIYVDPMTSDSGAWNVTEGRWIHDAAGMSNDRGGENRAFVDVLNGATSYAIEFTATLHMNKGWGIWLSTGLDAQDDATGYTFQYDPGWSPDSYLLRRWVDDSESVLMQNDLDVEYGEALDFRLEVDGDVFRAYQDGQLVMATNSITSHDGNLIGLRTWAGSRATFSNFNVTTIPAPPGAIAIASLALVTCLRRRS